MHVILPNRPANPRTSRILTHAPRPLRRFRTCADAFGTSVAHLKTERPTDLGMPGRPPRDHRRGRAPRPCRTTANTCLRSRTQSAGESDQVDEKFDAASQRIRRRNRRDTRSSANHSRERLTATAPALSRHERRPDKTTSILPRHQDGRREAPGGRVRRLDGRTSNTRIDTIGHRTAIRPLAKEPIMPEGRNAAAPPWIRTFLVAAPSRLCIRRCWERRRGCRGTTSRRRNRARRSCSIASQHLE